MEGAKFLKYLIDLKCRINILQKVVILWMDKAAGRVWGKGNREGIGLFHTTLSPVLSSRMPPSPCVSFSLSVSLTHKHSLHVASKHQPLFCLKADGTCNVMGGAQALKWSLDFTPTCFSWAWKTSSFSPEVQFPEGDLTSSTCLHRTTRRNLGLGILLTTVETYWVFILHLC